MIGAAFEDTNLCLALYCRRLSGIFSIANHLPHVDLRLPIDSSYLLHPSEESNENKDETRKENHWVRGVALRDVVRCVALLLQPHRY